MGRPSLPEAVSEKRRRGRPRLTNEALDGFLTFCGPEIQTRRGLLNVFYRELALDVLQLDPRFAWVADGAKMTAGVRGAWKPGILTELGRIRDADTMRAVALRICELKPKTREAVAMIRRFRLNREPPANYLDLVHYLAKALDGYVAVHPSTPDEWKIMAMQDLAELIGGDADE